MFIGFFLYYKDTTNNWNYQIYFDFFLDFLVAGRGRQIIVL